MQGLYRVQTLPLGSQNRLLKKLSDGFFKFGLWTKLFMKENLVMKYFPVFFRLIGFNIYLIIRLEEFAYKIGETKFNLPTFT